MEDAFPTAWPFREPNYPLRHLARPARIWPSRRIPLGVAHHHRGRYRSLCFGSHPRMASCCQAME